MQETKQLYVKKGFVQQSIGAIVTLIIGVAVATMVLIFAGVLAGQTYQLTESKINAISNTTIQNAVKDSALSGFTALKQTGDYLPLVVLAVIIVLILGIIMAMMVFGGGTGGSGFGGRSAL